MLIQFNVLTKNCFLSMGEFLQNVNHNTIKTKFLLVLTIIYKQWYGGAITFFIYRYIGKMWSAYIFFWHEM